MLSSKQASTKIIGYIGLGIMGQPAAINLIKAGYRVYGYARSPEKCQEFVRAGGELMDSVAGLAEQADVLITNLPDAPDVKEVLFEAGGAEAFLKSGSIVMDMSTISPLVAKEIYQRLQNKHIEFVDAPVSGGSIGAIEGTLSFMVGGSATAVAELEDLFAVMGSQFIRIGESGSGQICKCCNQMMVAQLISATSEVMSFAEQAGVDVARVRQALLGGFASSRALEVHGKRMLEHNYQPGFKAHLHLKDMNIVQQMCDFLKLDAQASKLVHEKIRQLVSEGKGDLDSSAIHLLRNIS